MAMIYASMIAACCCAKPSPYDPIVWIDRKGEEKNDVRFFAYAVRS